MASVSQSEFLSLFLSRLKHHFNPMQWTDYIGHQQQRDWFAAALRKGRLGSTFLFVGPRSIGKYTFAVLLAKTLLCTKSRPDQMQPCGVCESCVQIEALTHPDLLIVSMPANSSSIPIELFVGSRESRMHEGLCHDIRLRPYYGKRKIAIIDDADALNQEGANCLLKTLEEPPVGSIIILIGTSLQRQLPTIRSRCQIIRFGQLSAGQAKQLMQQGEVDIDDSRIDAALHLAGGDLSEAIELLDETTQQFHQMLNGLLSTPVPNAVRLAASVTEFVNAAGSDVPPRRRRMRQTFRMAIEVFRQRMLEIASDGISGDPAAMHNTLFRLDRCVEAINQVNRNANQQSLIEAWAWDLQRGTVLV